MTADVVLIVPPFASAAMPVLGPSLLLAQLRARGVSAQILYVNLLVAEAMGPSIYQQVAESDVRLMHGELLCAHSDADWFEAPAVITAALPQDLRACSQRIGEALDRAVDIIVALSPRIVGFSSSFQQNVASVFLARRLRNRLSSALLVIGGANVDEPMSDAFDTLFSDEFDHIFSGEADVSFPAFCVSVLSVGTCVAMPRIIRSGPAAPAAFAVTPEFGDYFEQGGGAMQQVLAGERILPIELSRGCWWGERHHCTFCGLNANGMTYRAKSALDVRAEIETLIARYAPNLFFASDNILSRTALREDAGLPHPGRLGYRYFFETKSNLSASDLDRLVELGIDEIQPGIESFSTAMLRRLRKGNSGPAHICLLREASSRQINVSWNLLVDVPGDEVSDYTAMADLIPLITHLQPPSGCTPIRIDRYSPYHKTPEAFGITDIKPVAAFTGVFGASAAATGICSFFEGNYVSAGREGGPEPARLAQAVQAWLESWSLPEARRSLVGLRNHRGEYVVVGQTGGAPPTLTVIDAADEELLFKTRRPLPKKSLDHSDRIRLDRYRDASIILLFEDQYVFLPAEPWRGAQLRRRRAEAKNPEINLITGAANA